MSDVRAQPILDAMRAGVEAQETKIMAQQLAMAEERLKLVDMQRAAEARERPKWYAEWIKPSFILPAAVILGGGFMTYQNDRSVIQSRFGEQGNALNTVVEQMKTGFKGVEDRFKFADDRAAKYLPMIEASRTANTSQDIINKQVSDRMQSVVDSLQDLRRSVETLRDLVQKTREELVTIEARRQRESKNEPHDMRSNTSVYGASQP